MLEGRPMHVGQANARYGSAVAISGDTMVVASVLEDSPVSNCGAAYVYVRSGPDWTLQQKLLPLDPSVNKLFGGGLDIEGDTMIVGAQGDAGARGAAYVFVRSGTTWTQQQKLVPTDALAGDEFGYSISISGDTAAISGEFVDLPGQPNAGAIWVFTRSGSLWTQQQKLTASDATAGDYFVNVATSGDTILVGADSDDTPAGTDAGSAYVFVRAGGAWTEVQKLIAPDGSSLSYFGWSVDLEGHTAVMGAPDVHAVYVFTRSETNWSLQQKLVASGPAWLPGLGRLHGRRDVGGGGPARGHTGGRGLGRCVRIRALGHDVERAAEAPARRRDDR
jgi:hypothetical protein